MPFSAVDKRQLLALKNMLKAVGSRDGQPQHVAMEDFVEAIDSVGIAATPDKVLLEKVYTLMDRTGKLHFSFVADVIICPVKA